MRHRRVLVAVKADRPLRGRSSQAVYHAETGAQNRNDGEILCKHGVMIFCGARISTSFALSSLAGVSWP